MSMSCWAKGLLQVSLNLLLELVLKQGQKTNGHQRRLAANEIKASFTETGSWTFQGWNVSKTTALMLKSGLGVSEVDMVPAGGTR